MSTLLAPKSIWETLSSQAKPFLNTAEPFLNILAQMSVEFAATAVTTLTTAQLARKWLGAEVSGIVASLGLIPGAAVGILVGAKYVSPLHVAAAIFVGMQFLSKLDSPMMPYFFAVYYSAKFVGVIAGSGARLVLNRAGWNNKIACATVCLSGLITTLINTDWDKMSHTPRWT